MIRTITQMGNPILRDQAASVTDFSETALRGLIDDMLETAAATGGVGIAAPQVGESLRLAIVASQPSERYPHAPSIAPIILINPVVEWKSEEMEEGWEGCLSIPGIRGIVPRSARIRVRYAAFPGTGDPAGRPHGEIIEEFEGFIARVVQHEMDHLVGTLFVDRVERRDGERLEDLVTEQEYRRIVAEAAQENKRCAVSDEQ
jgi:peptide deformylase